MTRRLSFLAMVFVLIAAFSVAPASANGAEVVHVKNGVSTLGGDAVASGVFIRTPSGAMNADFTFQASPGELSCGAFSFATTSLDSWQVVRGGYIFDGQATIIRDGVSVPATYEVLVNTNLNIFRAGAFDADGNGCLRDFSADITVKN